MRVGRRPVLPRLLKFSKMDDEGCLIWQGTISRGYGVLYLDGGRRRMRAHRASYEALIGPVPPGLQLDHLCRKPACINPAHLRAVTSGENTQASDSPSGLNARKTHCVRGHRFDAANTIAQRPRIGYGRRCRQCRDSYRKRKLESFAMDAHLRHAARNLGGVR